VPDQERSKGKIGDKCGQYFSKGMTFKRCTCGRDTVNLFCFEGDIEAVGFYDEVLARAEITLGVMQLPGDLNETRPVVEVGKRSCFVVRKSGSFCVKYEIHRVEERGCAAKVARCAQLSNAQTARLHSHAYITTFIPITGYWFIIGSQF
jgi:hypothetical protein